MKFESVKGSDKQAEIRLENVFSQKDLAVAWKRFVALIDAPQIRTALGIREPVLKDGYLIEYELDTELELNRLALDLKPRLLGFLRSNLRNESIEIQFKVLSDSTQPIGVPYTDSEKWALLAKKYPALASLKSKFGLDFEHF